MYRGEYRTFWYDKQVLNELKFATLKYSEDVVTRKPLLHAAYFVDELTEFTLGHSNSHRIGLEIANCVNGAL